MKNTVTKKLNDINILVDGRININGKKSNKKISSIKGLGITLTNN